MPGGGSGPGPHGSRLGPVGPIELKGCVWGQGSRSLKGGGRGLGPAAPSVTGQREVQGPAGDGAVLLRGAGNWPRAGASPSGGLWEGLPLSRGGQGASRRSPG